MSVGLGLWSLWEVSMESHAVTMGIDRFPKVQDY